MANKKRLPLLSTSEQAVLESLKQYARKNPGQIPTLREVAEGASDLKSMGLKNVSRVWQLLEEKGYVKRCLEICA